MTDHDFSTTYLGLCSEAPDYYDDVNDPFYYEV